jgi:hypothetical protein
MKPFIAIVILFLSLANANAQTFYDALDNYFSSGDLTQAKSFIGRTVANDDMRKVAKNYPGDGLDLSGSRPRLGVSVRPKNSMVILYSLTSKLVNGKNQYEIWDVIGIELKQGYTVYTNRLMTQSRDFPNGNMELDDAIGLLMIKEGKSVPVEQRLVPDWIVTADKEGKLIISKPTDRSKYLFVSGE